MNAISEVFVINRGISINFCEFSFEIGWILRKRRKKTERFTQNTSRIIN